MSSMSDQLKRERNDNIKPVPSTAIERMSRNILCLMAQLAFMTEEESIKRWLIIKRNYRHETV